MSSSAILVLVLGLGAIAWFTARARAMAFAVPGHGPRPHSRPNYHGWYVALWVLIPACLFLLIWSFAAPGLVMHDVLQAPAAAGLDGRRFHHLRHTSVPAIAFHRASSSIST